MEEIIASPKEVAQAIRNDIHSRHLTIAKAAKAIQKDPTSLYNIMQGTHRIRPQMAHLLHDEFGYSIPYLTKGIGLLEGYSKSDIILRPKSQFINDYPEQEPVSETVTITVKEYQELCEIKNAVLTIMKHILPVMQTNEGR